MDLEYQQLLNEVSSQTESELIRFFIIVAVVLVVVMVPVYTLTLKGRKHKTQLENDRFGQYMERERHIIRVITDNSEIMAGLKTTLEGTNASSNTSFIRVHERLDEQSKDIAGVRSTLEEVLRKQQSICDDIKREFTELRLNKNVRRKKDEPVSND